MITEIRIEQTPDSVFRMKYDPATDEFRTTAYRCRTFDCGFGGYYGWIVDTGTPPEPHLDILLLTDRTYDTGDRVICKIIGYFRRIDADHKFLGVEPHATIDDISQLQPDITQSLHRLYRGKYDGEVWLGRTEAERMYRTYIAGKLLITPVQRDSRRFCI